MDEYVIHSVQELRELAIIGATITVTAINGIVVELSHWTMTIPDAALVLAKGHHNKRHSSVRGCVM